MTIESAIVARQQRVKRLDVSPEMIIDLLKIDEGGTVIGGRLIRFVADDIPSTATAHRAGITADGLVRLIVEDESFEVVAEGALIPQLRPRYSAEVAP